MVKRFDPSVRQTLRAKLGALMTSGVWTAISVIGASLIGLALLMEARTGPIIASLVGLAFYGFSAYFVPNRVRARIGEDQVDDPPPPDNTDPRVELLVEAHQHLLALEAALPELPLPLKTIVETLVADGGAIVETVIAQPDTLNPVLRFFTYYLPATADLVQDRIKLAPHAGHERLAEIDQTLARLREAFAGFRAAVLEPDLESVDLDVTLLDDALDADLEDLKTR